MTWRRKTCRIASRAGDRGELANSGQDIVGDDDRPIACPQECRALGGGLGIARQHHGRRKTRLGQPLGVVLEDFRIATIGPTHEQQDVRAGAPKRGDLGPAEGPGRDVHHPRPGTQSDAVARQGRHGALIADHGQPQATAGARTDQWVDPWVRTQRRQRPLDAFKHIGARGRGHGGATAYLPVVEVDEQSLGEGAAHIDAR